jgi:hypothetical protein
MSLVTPDMQDSVGSLVDWRVSFPVAASDIRKWAIATYFPDPPPSHYLSGQDVIAPEEFNPFAWVVAEQMVPAIAPERRDTDKPEKAIGITGPGLRNQVNGGTEVTYTGTPIRPGDVIRSETRLVSYAEKSGRMGAMLITTFESVWTNQDGAQVEVERQVSIRY